MSFWGGVAKGFEAGEAKREREEVRDTAAARNVLQDKRWQMQWENTLAQQTKDDSRAELADARLLEAHGLAMAKGTLTLTESINKLGGGTSGGTGSTVGARSSKTGPTAIEMDVGARALQARIDDLGGLDSMTSADQAYYKPILGNAAASYELNKLLAEAVGDDEDLTILNAADRVRTVAIVAAQGQEAFAAYSKKAAKDGWSPEKVLEAMELAKGVNPAFAELVLLTPSRKNLTEQEQFNTFEAGLQFYIADWKKNNPNKVTDAFTTATSKLKSSNEQTKNEGLSTLVSMGVGQDWILKNTKEGNALHNLIPKEVSAVPEVGKDGNLVTGGGGAVPPGTPTYTAAELLELPPAEARKLVGTRIIVDGKPGTYGIPGTSTFEGQTGASDDAKAAGVTGRLDSKGEGFVMPEAAAEGVTSALLAGQKTREALSNLPGVTSPEYELTAAYINATDDMTSALNRGAANAADFIFGVMGGTEQTDVAEWLRADADRIDAKADMTAEALVDGMNGWFGGLFSTDTKAEATENVAKILTRGSDTPAAKALLETIQERVDYAAKRKVPPEVAEEGYTPPTMEATEINTPAVREALANVPTEVADATIAIIANGTEEEIVRANEEAIKEFGAVAAGVLFDNAKAARGTGRSAVMDGLQTPYSVSADEEGYQPTSMGATELNTPAMRKAIAKVPTEVRDAVTSILERGDQEAIDQANEELAKEFGKDVAAVLFDDAKSARGTGKSAVMDGLQTPGGLDTSGIRQVLAMVKSKIGPEVSSVLSKGYLQTTMGSTELNTPAILQALLKVEEQLGPDVVDLITESFGPDVSAILFDDLKSARGTGKSAMMSGLQ